MKKGQWRRTSLNSLGYAGRLRFLLASLVLCCLPANSYADGAGMFLCRSPVVTNDFWTDLNQAAGAGVKLNMEIARNIAQKNACPFVCSTQADRLRRGPIGVTDGKIKGWAAPQLYIMYDSRPANERFCRLHWPSGGMRSPYAARYAGSPSSVRSSDRSRLSCRNEDGIRLFDGGQPL
jgi:hypothetical protein